MYQLSKLFHDVFDELVAQDSSVTKTSEFCSALLYNLLLQTSCFRYWGQGRWTEYAKQIYNRGISIVNKASQTDAYTWQKHGEEIDTMQQFGY